VEHTTSLSHKMLQRVLTRLALQDPVQQQEVVRL
jgi:hypothetical protein